jgi:hypothetical protein
MQQPYPEVVAFNTAERVRGHFGRCRPRLRRRCDLQMRDLPSSLKDFVERHERPDRRQLTLRFVYSTRIFRPSAYFFPNA